jgi:hypothetical protein
MAKKKKFVRTIFIVCIATSLTGCIGTLDTAFRVHGHAPEQMKCEVKTIRAETGEVIYRKLVSGEFINTVVIGGLDTSQIDVVAECDGKTLKKVEDVAPAKYWESPLELGDISP